MTRRARRATSAPRPLPLLVALAAVAAFVAAPPANATRHRLESPRAADIAVSSGAVRYASVSALAGRLAAEPGFWGGDYTAATGEHVKIFSSSMYPEDAVIGQRWADFLSGLIHGPELVSLTSYLVTPSEVRSVCGRQALACYSDRESILVAPGEDARDVTAEALITHEYGHHVAAHRSNSPWPAVEWGTKRWATYLQVCRNTRSKTMFPGAENASEYARNPGEGFAEAYRVLNERRAGIAEAPWDIVDRVFYPDDTALAQLEQDVVSPWTKSASSVLSGAFSAVAKAHSFSIATPLDGSLTLSVRAPRTGRLKLALFTSEGASSGSSTTARASGTATVKTTVCGTRAYRATVSRVAGSGAYGLTVSNP